MSQLHAMPILTAYSTAFLFVLGSVPGWPRLITLTWVFGAWPKTVLSPQNNLLLVESWAWTSSPITTSYVSFAGTPAKIANDKAS
jgi:hypothetical protein